MGTKLNPGIYDCHTKALPDEPTFTLSARDPTAPYFLRAWANHRDAQIAVGARPRSDLEQVNEARKCAVEMETWRKDANFKWREANDLT